MKDSTITEIELSHLLSNAPSVIRNSVFLYVVRVIAGLLGSLLLVGGLAFLISGVLSEPLMEFLLVNEFEELTLLVRSQLDWLSVLVGGVAICLGVCYCLLRGFVRW